MCIANLNVALQPCSHRWYTLRQPCHPSTNLANCPGKLRLEGWETRNDSCPWCSSDSTPPNESTHRLFGGSISGSTRTRRASSATNSISSLSRSNSSARGYMENDDEETTMSRGERARMMNYRLDLYLTTNPEWKVAAQSKRDDDESDRDSPPESDGPMQPVARRGSVIGKGWKKSVKLSRGMFKA